MDKLVFFFCLLYIGAFMLTYVLYGNQESTFVIPYANYMDQLIGARTHQVRKQQNATPQNSQKHLQPNSSQNKDETKKAKESFERGDYLEPSVSKDTYKIPKFTNGSQNQVEEAKEIVVLSWCGSIPTERGKNGPISRKSCPLLKPGHTCFFTSKRSYLREAGAVVIRGRYMKSVSNIPLRPSTDQKWIFKETEAPTKTWDRVIKRLSVWNKFNLTSTYTLDSDVPRSGYSQKCTEDPQWNDCSSTPKSCRNYAGGKTGLVAWVVSHCSCPSRRELYVKELMKHIDVHVFGDCGQPFCGRAFQPPQKNNTCMKYKLEKYKFYLSFENSFCEEYYTEKFVQTLHMDLVPIVLGHYNYSQLVPKGSYIDVRDFASPQKLAEFLIYLDHNDTAYNIMMNRRKQVKCEADTERSSSKTYECRLCAHLHEHQGDTEIAPDIRKFWGIKKRCTDWKDFYKGIADDIVNNHIGGALKSRIE